MLHQNWYAVKAKYVLRTDPSVQRIQCRYEALVDTEPERSQANYFLGNFGIVLMQ